MPLIDMPLEQMKVYQGRNPRPADFDEYWDKALAEMRALDPQIEIVPHDSPAANAECFHLYFTGVGGARIHAKYLRPTNAPAPHPGIVWFHGYSGSSTDWFNYLGWAGQGFSVMAIDVRGQGGLSEDIAAIKGNTYRGHIIRGIDDAPEKLLFRSIYLDCAQLAGILMGMPEVDPERIGAMGISQGGGLTLACAALEPRIKRAVSWFPFLCDFKRVWEMDLAKQAYEELRMYFRMIDPLHEREDEVFTRLGYIDNQFLAPRIKGDLLMLTCLMDDVCPPSAQFAAYNKMTCNKSMAIWPDYGHELGIPRMHDLTHQFLMKL